MQDGASALHIPTRCIGVQGLPKNPPAEGLDGVCISLLVLVKPRMNAKVSREDRYFWHRVESPSFNKFIDELSQNGPEFCLLW